VKTVYISLQTEKGTCEEIAKALAKLLDRTTLDDVGGVYVSKVTVYEHRGTGGRRTNTKSSWNEGDPK
jgi:hypothetical protein